MLDCSVVVLFLHVGIDFDLEVVSLVIVWESDLPTNLKEPFVLGLPMGFDLAVEWIPSPGWGFACCASAYASKYVLLVPWSCQTLSLEFQFCDLPVLSTY